ncbi:hypothetical protein QQF64_032485 [Cirrhinus molitorella]|uniref:Uncharacterized protein n=1 Tax=Cirrhinus molitorella TaxID=172907 RepID=A0ABR3N061_9TELE
MPVSFCWPTCKHSMVLTDEELMRFQGDSSAGQGASAKSLKVDFFGQTKAEISLPSFRTRSRCRTSAELPKTEKTLTMHLYSFVLLLQ